MGFWGSVRETKITVTKLTKAGQPTNNPAAHHKTQVQITATVPAGHGYVNPPPRLTTEQRRRELDNLVDQIAEEASQ